MTTQPQPLDTAAIQARCDAVRSNPRIAQVIDVADAEALLARVAELEAQVNAIATIRVWRTEDGIEFLYADDVRTALGCPTPAAPDAR